MLMLVIARLQCCLLAAVCLWLSVALCQKMDGWMLAAARCPLLLPQPPQAQDGHPHSSQDSHEVRRSSSSSSSEVPMLKG